MRIRYERSMGLDVLSLFIFSKHSGVVCAKKPKIVSVDVIKILFCCSAAHTVFIVVLFCQ